MKLDEADRLLSDRERPAGAHRSAIDEKRRSTLLDVLAVIVTGEDQQRPRVFRQCVEERMGGTVLVHHDDVGP